MTILPLTQAQHGIWVGQQMVPQSAVYWTAEALSLQGDLNVIALHQALNHVLRHAQALHMSVDERGQAHYPSLPTADPQPPFELDVSDQSDPWAAAWQAMERMQPPAPDMRQDPLFAQALIKLEPQHHVWVLWAHHLVLDGWGHMLLARAVVRSYELACQGQALPDLTHWDMAPIAQEDQQQQASSQQSRHASFWREQMQDAPTPSLAAPLPLASTVRREQLHMDAERFATWQKLAVQHKMDWSIWLLAGVAAWLWQQTGKLDLTLGLPVMNRLGSSTLSVPCMTMNMVPLRVQVHADDTLLSLAQQIAQRLRAIRPHQRHRYESMRRDLSRMGGTRRLFGPVVNIMPFDRPLTTGPAAGALRIETHTVSGGPVEDLSINIIPLPDHAGLTLKLEAHPQAYSAHTLQTHARALQRAWTTLQDHVESPIRAVLPSQREQTQAALPSILQGPSLPSLNTTSPYGSAILNAVCMHAQARPDHPAVWQAHASNSYAQLWTQAHRIGMALQAHLPHTASDHASPASSTGPKILVMLPREARTVSALLAVWLLGGCYIPIDPQTPSARLDMVLADAQPDLVLTHADLLPRIPAHLHTLTLNDALLEPATIEGQRELTGPASADACAYVIYTSGSTGKPNGVMISHRALGHFLAGARQVYRLTPVDRMLQFAPLHFDASVEELYLPLFTGATVVLRNEAMLESPSRFLSTCQQWEVTVMDLPTAYWHELAYAMDGDAATRSAWPSSTRLVIIGGEAALSERLQRWQRHVPTHVTLLNTYGPTEATVICATAELAGPHAQAIDQGLPIGTPLPGISLAIVGEHGHLVPRGETGQLCILGEALALGYWDRAALTAQRFKPLAHLPDAPRCYHTGDLACINVHGQLVFQGRLDDEIKISGHRIDPGEVEAALLSHPDVVEVAVLGQISTDGDKRLVAFVVANSAGQEPSWRDHLAQRLPAAALPACYVSMPVLPRNANNKIDRKALQTLLPAPAPTEQRPCSDLESTIISVWRTLLGHNELTPNSDFFALGGRSLQAIQASTRLGVLLQREVPVAWLFAQPTVTGLAKALAAPVVHQPPPLSMGAELAPLLPIQQPLKRTKTEPALFCVHPAEGLSWCYFGLCRYLPHIPIWGLQSRGMTGPLPISFDAMVDDYLALIRQAQSRGPYRLLGWSSGGGVAHALACRLQDMGETVSLLALMDAYPADIWENKPEPTEGDALEALLDVIGANAWDAQGQRLPVEAMKALLRQADGSLSALDESVRERMVNSAVHGMRLYRTAQHGLFHGPTLYFRAAVRPDHAPSPESWSRYITCTMDMVDIDSNHNAMSQPQPLSVIGQHLATYLASPLKAAA